MNDFYSIGKIEGQGFGGEMIFPNFLVWFSLENDYDQN